MNYKHIISFLLLWVSLNSYSQDTIRIGESHYYTSSEIKKLSGKGFLGSYGQENIVFSGTHTKVEYCYYAGLERNAYGYHYRIVNDSLLTIGDSLLEHTYETWLFKEIENNQFYVYRFLNGLLESGKVDALIPLRQIAPFVTTTLNKKDTLWESNDFTCMNRKYGYYTANFNISKVSGEIYDYNEIDKSPSQLNGDSLSSIEIENIYPCISQPMTWINTVSCVITKDGRIVNIEQALGNISENCSYTLMEINKLISSWGPIKPALKNGIPVNVRWFIKIDNLSQPIVHPAFADTEENRKEYLKKRKRFANNR